MSKRNCASMHFVRPGTITPVPISRTLRRNVPLYLCPKESALHEAANVSPDQDRSTKSPARVAAYKTPSPCKRHPRSVTKYRIRAQIPLESRLTFVPWLRG